MSWGDLDESGKPISKDAGRLYQQWVSNVCGYGYRFAHRILNSADYGAYTTRRRFFGIFAKESLPIVFPEPTHSKDGATGLFGRTQRWKPVREVLDFSDEGESIFGRKKPLVDATLERIYAGLIKFVAGGKEAFLVKWNSMSQTGKCGECAFFKNEDANGYGHCIITLNQYRCDDLCKFKEDHMSDVETLRALHHYQKWRRGGNGRPPHPFVIGQTIDNAIRTLRRITKDTPKF